MFVAPTEKVGTMSTQDHIDNATSLFMKLLTEKKSADEIKLAAASVIAKVRQQIKDDEREDA